jgi:hypothetical protein
MSKTDLIPLLCPKGGSGGGAKAAESGAPKKRMIADADTAVIDDSMIPEPLVLYVAAIASVGTGAALFVGLAFKAAEWAMLVALPAVALAWGLTAAFFAPWTCATLELDAYGALAAGISGCALNKAKVLPLVAVLFAAAVESPLLVPSDSSWPSAPVLCGLCTAKQLVVAVPALAALANSQAAAFTNYFTKSQKAAVEMAKRVRREARRSESLSRTSVGNCCCAEAR